MISASGREANPTLAFGCETATLLWHYTDRDSAADAIRDKLLKAHPVIVRSALIGGEEILLDNAVWFTVAETFPPTVLAKLTLGGWPLDKPGILWRIGVADEVAPEDLPDWAFRRQYETSLFRWMLLTAHLAREDWEQWRLCDEAVEASKWLAVQSLHGDTWKEESQ